MTRLGWVCVAVACTPAPEAVPAKHARPSVVKVEVPEEPDPVLAKDDSVPRSDPSWPLLGTTGGCKECLPSAEDRCATKRESCTSAPACLSYLDCVAKCPPPETRDAAGGYPQADCVIACRSKSEQSADLGDGYLWCVCCETSCQTACGGECGHFKSGIAGPIGAGCD